MRAIIFMVLLPVLTIAATVYVTEWPDKIPVSGGVMFHPTAAQCRAAGYELEKNRPPPTAEELAAQAAADAAIAAATIIRTNALATLKKDARQTTKDICKAVGITITNKLTYTDMQTLVYPLLMSTNDGVSNVNKIEAISLMIRLHQDETLINEERQDAP